MPDWIQYIAAALVIGPLLLLIGFAEGLLFLVLRQMWYDFRNPEQGEPTRIWFQGDRNEGS